MLKKIFKAIVSKLISIVGGFVLILIVASFLPDKEDLPPKSTTLLYHVQEKDISLITV